MNTTIIFYPRQKDPAQCYVMEFDTSSEAQNYLHDNGFEFDEHFDECTGLPGGEYTDYVNEDDPHFRFARLIPAK